MKLIEVTKEHLKFEDGTTVTFYHPQDCCEHVYAEFEALKDKIGVDFPSWDIEKVEGSGFRISGEFIPCYDSQNGYYGSDLELIITLPDDTRICRDITKCAAKDYCG